MSELPTQAEAEIKLLRDVLGQVALADIRTARIETGFLILFVIMAALALLLASGAWALTSVFFAGLSFLSRRRSLARASRIAEIVGPVGGGHPTTADAPPSACPKCHVPASYANDCRETYCPLAELPEASPSPTALRSPIPVISANELAAWGSREVI